MGTMQYRAEIDGLRAVAVLPVIFFHAGFDIFRGGFVGVDVFFVISGYLITSILISEIDNGVFSLVRFYERRARRILPALFTVMAVSIPCAWLWLLPEDMKNFSQSLVAVSFFSSNFLFWQESGYFETATELKPLIHTWSLAVEEQYYVLFPLFLMLFWKKFQKRITCILAIVAVVSLVLAEWGSRIEPAAAFYLLPTRGWELLVGTFAALYFSINAANIERVIGGWKYQCMSLLGLLMIAISIFSYDKSTPFPGIYALLPTIGSFFIILYACPGTIVHRVLGCKIAVGIGLISYSAYLWHQPLIAFSRIRFGAIDGDFIMLSLMPLTLVLAFITWKYVETPFRGRSGKRISTPIAISLFSMMSAIFITIGIAGHVQNGFKNYFLEHRLTQEDAMTFRLLENSLNYNMYDVMFDNGDCNFWGRSIDERFLVRFNKCKKKYDRAVIVLGDSHAMNVYNVIGKARVYNFVVGISQGGCRVHNNQPSCHYDGFSEFVKNNVENLNLVLYHQSGSYLIQDENGNVDSSLTFETGKSYRFVDRDIQDVFGYISDLNKKIRTIWIGPFVEARVNFKDVGTILYKKNINENSIQIFQHLDSHIQSINNHNKEKITYVSLVDGFGFLGSNIRIGDCILYRDGDHFSQCGEEILAERFRPELIKLLE